MADIVFSSGIRCSTAYGYDMAYPAITENKALPEDMLVDVNPNQLTATNGVLNNYTLKTTKQSLWGGSTSYYSGEGFAMNYFGFNLFHATHPTVSSFNLLCVPFVSGTQRRYLVASVTNINTTGSFPTAKFRVVWSNTPDLTDPAAVTTQIGAVKDMSFRSNYKETFFFSCRMIKNYRFGVLYDGEMEHGDTALVLTYSASDPFHNPAGDSPFEVTWNIRASDGAYLFNAPVCINADTMCIIIPLAAVKTYGLGDCEYYENQSEEAGPASEPQGMETPTFDETSDTIDIPTAPTIGITNVGFVRVYNTGIQSLQDLGVELFPPLQYSNPPAVSGQSTTEAIVNGFNAIVTFFGNVPSFFEQIMANTLISYVIDCHVIPVTPLTSSSPEAIHVGYKELQVTAPRVTSDYVDFTCGSINIGEFYENFADYLTTAKLYLPFVGFVPVRAEWFQAATLSVDYRFNVIDGSFVAFVRSTGKHTNNGNASGTILGQYAGNACIHLPITGPTYASMVAGLVGAGSGMAAGAASGNPAAVATSAIAAAAQHGDIAQSNAYNGSAAFLGCRYPFLMIERPVSSYAMNYQHEIGIPANIYSTIGSVSGFVKADNVHLDAIPCTDAEREMIQTALREGVIV